MSEKRNYLDYCFVYKLTESPGVSDSFVALSDSDISRFEGFAVFYRSLRQIYGDRLGMPRLVGAEIRVGFVDSDELTAYSAGQVIANFDLAAAQLHANAERESPLPHSAALSHPGVAKVLEAAANANRKAGTQVIVRTEDGDAEVPILAPGAFVQPVRGDQHRQPGTFAVTGLLRNSRNRIHGLLLTDNHIQVLLPTDDPRWAWKAVRDVLEMKTYFVGTIFRESKSSAWKPGDDARLEFQQEFNEFDQSALGSEE